LQNIKGHKSKHQQQVFSIILKKDERQSLNTYQVFRTLGAFMLAIKIKNLTKSYGSFLALKGINLEIEEGEIFALLGPNGAGKTTLIRILAEGLKFDSGDIEVLGEKLSKKTARVIGYVPQ